MFPVSAAACSREVLLDAALHLPAAPQVLAEINELLLDPHLQLDDVVTVLRRDATLASTIIRIANSALYVGPRIGSIEDAVARIGLAEVFRVVGLATTARLGSLALPTYGVPARLLGRNALLHALAAESLAPFLGIDPLVAYTAGLLRPLGVLVLDQLVRPTSDPAVPPFAGPDFLERERERTGFTSPEVGALVLEAWRFAPTVVEAVRLHHLTGDAAHCPLLALTLNLAGALVADLGSELPFERGYWRQDRATCELAGVSEEQFALAHERTSRQFERQRFALD